MKQYFWGIFLISSGVFLVLKHYLNINIPTGRMIIALFLISLGISVLIGGFGVSDENQLIFHSGKLAPASTEKEYNILFGQGNLDLTDLSPTEGRKKMEVNTIFATTELILPQNMTVYIQANAAFASTIFPDGSSLSFGDRAFRTGTANKQDADLVIEMNTVFGRTTVRQR